MAKISEARERTNRVRALLAEAGDTRGHKALATRYETVLTPSLDSETAAVREALEQAMRELEELLARDFRVDHAAP